MCILTDNNIMCERQMTQYIVIEKTDSIHQLFDLLYIISSRVKTLNSLDNEGQWLIQQLERLSQL